MEKSRKSKPPEEECSICYGAHDEEIHEATLSVLAWFRDYVNLSSTKWKQPTPEELEAKRQEYAATKTKTVVLTTRQQSGML
jgi:hypothetical protein